MDQYQRWIIKSADGRISPPKSQREIFAMIEAGSLSGDEDITPYPGGEWKKIVDIPEFYQRIVAELEGPQKQVEATPPAKKKKKKKPASAPEQSSADSKTIDETQIVEPPAVKVEHLKNKPKIKSLSYYAQAIPVLGNPLIRNSNRKKPVERKKSSGSIFPFLVILGIGGYLLWSLMTPVENEKPKPLAERIHLKIPEIKSQTKETPETLKKRATLALYNIERDTFKNLLDAEGQLISLVEAVPSNVGYRGLLCYTYLELWDYSFKDAQDLKTVEMVAQSTRSLNVSSPEGYFCEAVRLFLNSKNVDAKVTLENLFDSNSQFSILPLVYYLRGLLFVDDGDQLQSSAFFLKAQELWPTWTRPTVVLARQDTKQRNFNEAATRYQGILAKNKEHFESLLGLGILNYKYFKQPAVGENLILTGFKTNNKGPRPLMAEAYGVLAETFADKGNKARAKELAEKALDMNPSSSELKQLVLRLGGSDTVSSQVNRNEDLIFRADQYARSGDCLSAQAEYKAAFEANPKFGMAAVKAAQCLWQLYQTYDALEWLKKAVKAEPGLVQAYVLQADYLSQRFDFSGANQVLNNAMAVSKNSSDVLRGYAQLELRKNNFQGAISFGLRAMKIYDADAATFVILSKAYLNQANAMVPVTKPDNEKRNQYFRDALRFATKAAEIDSTSAEAQVNYANVLAATGGMETGVKYLKEMTAKYPFANEYRVAMADLYRGEEHFPQAKEIYERVITIDQKNKAAFLGLGICQKAMGANDQALKSFLSAAVIDPTDGEGIFQAAQIYFESGRFKEALDNYLRVRRVNPLYPRSNLAIAKTYLRMEDYNSAFAAAQDEKKLNPQLAEAYLVVAEIQMGRKNYQECSNEYATALKLRSQDPKIYVKAAVCYRLANSLDVAQDMLDLAKQMESGYADIYREQGALFKLRGDIPAAIKSYRMYLELSPNAKDRKDVELALSQIGG